MKIPLLEEKRAAPEGERGYREYSRRRVKKSWGGDPEGRKRILEESMKIFKETRSTPGGTEGGLCSLSHAAVIPAPSQCPA